MTCHVNFSFKSRSNITTSAPTINLLSVFTGYWGPFRISQNLPKHSTATKAATWFLTTSAVCGDPQTFGMGSPHPPTVPLPSDC